MRMAHRLAAKIVVRASLPRFGGPAREAAGGSVHKSRRATVKIKEWVEQLKRVVSETLGSR